MCLLVRFVEYDDACERSSREMADIYHHKGLRLEPRAGFCVLGDNLSGTLKHRQS